MKLFIVLSIFSGIVQTICQSVECKNGAVLLGNHCYKFSSTIQTYKEAFKHCKSLGGALATIENELQQQDIASFIQRSHIRSQSYFISLRYDVYKEYFHWNEDKPLEYEAWDRDHPNQQRANTCVVMTTEAFFTWRSVPCNSLNLHVCEFDPPEGHVFKTPADMYDDNELCSGRVGYFSHPYWNNSYVWCNQGDMKTYECSAGNYFDAKLKVCVLEEDSHVIEDEINTTVPKTTTSTVSTTKVKLTTDKVIETTTNRSELKCQKGFQKHNKKCFKFFFEIKSWYDSAQTCYEQNSQLAKITSEMENEFLSENMFSNQNSTVKYFWIGLNDQTKDKYFTWQDGSELLIGDFTKWSKHANKSQSKWRKCIAVNDVYKKKWRDELCSRDMMFVCQQN